MSDAILEARGLTKLYRLGELEVSALRGVDFELFPREFVVLLGPSGSGKSTLLHILGGLDTPTAGSFRYRDHDLTHATDALLTHYRREHVGFVFQFYNLIPSLSARENVELATVPGHARAPRGARSCGIRGKNLAMSSRCGRTDTARAATVRALPYAGGIKSDAFR